MPEGPTKTDIGKMAQDIRSHIPIIIISLYSLAQETVNLMKEKEVIKILKEGDGIFWVSLMVTIFFALVTIVKTIEKEQENQEVNHIPGWIRIVKATIYSFFAFCAWVYYLGGPFALKGIHSPFLASLIILVVMGVFVIGDSLVNIFYKSKTANGN